METALFELELLPIQWGVVIGASLVAAFTDLRSRTIPNWLTGPLFIGGLVASVVLGGGWGLLSSLIAAVLLALPYLVLFVLVNGGAGDAKLMAALGSWLGLATGVVVLVSVVLTGVIVALAWAWMHRATHPRIEDAKKLTMPYGLAISAGVCVAAAGLWWVQL